MTTADNAKLAKNGKLFYCILCDYKTTKKYNYNIHCDTIKHKNNGLTTADNAKLAKIENKKYICENCEKMYNDRAGLWRHKKKCKINGNINNNNNNNENNSYQGIENKCNIDDNSISNLDISNKDDLIIMLLKQNSKLIEQNSEFIKNGVNNINNMNCNNNSNNKSFNLNVFLNETCKNAMNIMDFANSIQPKLTDLENIGELGYVDGISKIIIDNLKLLDISERPVHCSDFKRDVIYVRNANKWEKDSDALAKIKKVINCVTNKNISLISEWKKQNPDCIYSDSIKSTKINKMIMEVMETDPVKRDKIIKNIAKQVIINKNIN
jgi:hypothetical protein